MENFPTFTRKVCLRICRPGKLEKSGFLLAEFMTESCVPGIFYCARPSVVQCGGSGLHRFNRVPVLSWEKYSVVVV